MQHNNRRLHGNHQYQTTTHNANGKPKYTTRRLAALDFLLHIPMKNESKILSRYQLAVAVDSLKKPSVEEHGGLQEPIANVAVYDETNFSPSDAAGDEVHLLYK